MDPRRGKGARPHASAYRWLLAIALHFAISLAGFWLVIVAGIGVAESSSAVVPRWLGPATIGVNFGLLQPLAHWLLELLPVRYWTWPGLAASTLILAVNSCLAIGICRGAAYAARRARGIRDE